MKNESSITAKMENHLIPTVKVAMEPFDADSTANCTLCLEIDESRFRFCFIDETNMTCVWLEDYAFDTFLRGDDYLRNLQTLVAEHPYLASERWRDVKVSVNTHAFTLIPASLFRKEYASDYLQLATGKPLRADFKVLYYLLPHVNAYTVFSMPSKWSDWLLNQYTWQSIEFYHLTSPLIIGTIVSHREFNEAKLVTLHLEEDYFTMIYSESEELRFCNRFAYQTPLEFTYLVLFSLNQLGVLPEEVKVKLYGEITPYSDLYSELSKFIPELQFGKNPSTLKYIDQFEDIPEHRYFGLLNSFLVLS